MATTDVDVGQVGIFIILGLCLASIVAALLRDVMHYNVKPTQTQTKTPDQEELPDVDHHP